MNLKELVSDHAEGSLFLFMALVSAIGFLVNMVAHKRSALAERLADLVTVLVLTLASLVDLLDLLSREWVPVCMWGLLGILSAAYSGLGLAFSRKERWTNWALGLVGLFAILFAIVKAVMNLWPMTAR